jgi:hypothetical protein
MSEEIIVSSITLGFSLSMLFYFWGQLSRIFVDVVDTIIKR